ncbi:MAG: metallophosphoesterase [Thermosynechococcaceae cyanobacterium]
MTTDLRFAVVSDLHIGLPHTILDHPTRFHLVEVSIPAFEQVLDHLSQLDLDFLLIPGDLTQHGEPENHAWLAQRLAQLPFPVYVIPGNHDVPVPEPDGTSIGWRDFPSYYRKCGYETGDDLYYAVSPVPGVQLIALNSNQFDVNGRQIGSVDAAQLQWLEQTLEQSKADLVLAMIHHNVLEHLPDQTCHPIGRRYMLANAAALLEILQAAKVQFVFTGHLHVQDIAYCDGLLDITTGSLVSYPHPYRIVRLRHNATGQPELTIESHRVRALPDWPTLQDYSRQWMGDRSVPFITYLLTHPPLNLSPQDAAEIVPHLKYFWATIADGDPEFQFPEFPADLRTHFESYSHRYSLEAQLHLQDNHIRDWV